MSLRFRGKVGPFVVDAPLTQKPQPQGSLSGGDVTRIVVILGLAFLLCGGALVAAL